MQDPVKFETLKRLLQQKFLSKEEKERWERLLARLTDEQAGKLIENLKKTRRLSYTKQMFEAMQKLKDALKPLAEEEKKRLLEDMAEVSKKEAEEKIEEIQKELKKLKKG